MTFRVVVEDWPGSPLPNRMSVHGPMLRLKRLRHGTKT